VILKLAGDACNINCYYCYEKRRPQDRKQWLEPGVLAKFLESCGDRPLRIVLHGGEPLLVGIKRMRALLEILRGYPGPLEMTMQTNGMLLTDAWIDLFEELCPDIDVGVSLDGPREANAHRVDYRDRTTFDKVIAGIDLLARRGHDMGICLTVTPLVLGRERETMQLIADLPRVRAVRLSPCLDYNVTTRTFPVGNADALMQLNGTGQGAPGWATTPMEYAKFVAACFDFWRVAHFREFTVEPILSIMLMSLDGESFLTDWSQRKEPYIVTLHPNGGLSTSDEISGISSAIGHVDSVSDLDEVIRYQRNPALADAMHELLEVCGSCSHEAVCSGGSLADRLRFRGTGVSADYCDARRWLIDYVREAM
jgi:uncharacterized protein